MSLMNMISKEEQALISAYRESYIEDHTDRICDNEYLLRVWQEEKSKFLANIFKDSLILKKEVVVKSPRALVVEEMEKRLIYFPFIDGDVDPGTPKDFSRQIIDLVDELYEKKCIDSALRDAMHHIDGELLADNRFVDRWEPTCKRNFKVTYPSDKEKSFTISYGMKLMKVYNKFATAFGIAGFDEYAVAHSQILNTTNLKGTLCLSIHPLDYMTMSDNDSNWTSCMSWKNGGEYRQGTVEMMNSDCIVVGYLESSTPMDIFGAKWNNKKYRSLYCVNKDIIANIKGYPYKSLEIDKIIINWLKELVETNTNIKYESDIIDFNSNENDYYLDFRTNIMYNDCCNIKGHKTCHIGYVSDLTSHDCYVCYSGPNECMCCGATEVMDDRCESDLICESCDDYCYCDHCGDRYYSDEICHIDGLFLCEYCYNEIVAKDFFDGTEYLRDNMVQIKINANSGNKMFVDQYCVYSISINIENIEKFISVLPKIIKKEKISHYTTLSEKEVYYRGYKVGINWSDLSDYGWNFFFRGNNTEIKSAKRFCERYES